VPITPEDQRALPYLLDRLCEHEESWIESGTTIDGDLPRNDAQTAREVLRSRRIWKRAQKIMRALDEEAAHAHS
jgi:hypothetical protein